MRLSPVVTIKGKHLFPSPKMSLLKNSNEKLNDMFIDNCQDLPGLMANKALVFAKHCYQQTEDHRRRLANHLQKNWLRLLLSAIVLTAQFVWFISNFVELTLFKETKMCFQNVHSVSDLIAPVLEPEFVTVSNEKRHQSFNQRLLEYDPHLGSQNIDRDQASDSDQLTASNYKEKNLFEFNDHNSRHSSFSSRLSALLWKTLFLCKFALIMLFFELFRLSDTVVNVIRQINDEEDEKNRSPPKSPVDTGYIERNRGYK